MYLLTIDTIVVLCYVSELWIEDFIFYFTFLFLLYFCLLELEFSMISLLHISHKSHNAVTVMVTQSYIIEGYKKS